MERKVLLKERRVDDRNDILDKKSTEKNCERGRVILEVLKKEIGVCRNVVVM
jgi:hypothetical protein